MVVQQTFGSEDPVFSTGNFEPGAMDSSSINGNIFALYILKHLTAEDVEIVHKVNTTWRATVKDSDYEKQLWTKHWKDVVVYWDNGWPRKKYSLRDGKKHGTYTLWYKNTKLQMICTFVHDKMDGLLKQWNENGNQWEECTYVQGELHGLYIRWYENGRQWETGTYVQDKKDGLYRHWYENGQLSVECTYVQGELHGLYRKWHANGCQWEECTYVQNKKDGLYRCWYI